MQTHPHTPSTTPPPDSQAQPKPVHHPTAPPPKQKSGLGSLISTLLLFAAAPFLAVLMIIFVFQTYEVDGPSMQHTLENRDRLIILKIPRTWARITGHTYIPERNDIIVFNRNLGDGLPGQDRQLIKRVIGLPGDHIIVKNNRITIYNEAFPDGFNPDDTVPSSANNKESSGEVDLTVKPGQLFVAGDNRPNSLDSRYFGTIGANQVVGKLALRIWPFNQFDSF